MPRNVCGATAMNMGAHIPQVGLGVWQMARGDFTRQAVTAALRGYRHIDTARIYGNETDVGEAIRASGIARQEIFVTTKLWNEDQGYDGALRAFDGSFFRLGVDYLDLYLISCLLGCPRKREAQLREKLRKPESAWATSISRAAALTHTTAGREEQASSTTCCGTALFAGDPSLRLQCCGLARVVLNESVAE